MSYALASANSRFGRPSTTRCGSCIPSALPDPPKPIVHGHGVMLESLKLTTLHNNVGPSVAGGDRFHVPAKVWAMKSTAPAADASASICTWSARSLKGLLGAVCLGVLVAPREGESSSSPSAQKVRDMQRTMRWRSPSRSSIELIEEGNRQGEILYRYGRALSLTENPNARSGYSIPREDPEWFVRASQQLAFDAERGGNYDFGIDVFRRLHEEAPESIDNDPFGLLLEVRMILSSGSTNKALSWWIRSSSDSRKRKKRSKMKAVALLGLKRADDDAAGRNRSRSGGLPRGPW